MADGGAFAAVKASSGFYSCLPSLPIFRTYATIAVKLHQTIEGEKGLHK